MNRAQQQTDVTEAVWPKTMIRIRNRGAQIHSPGRVLDGIIKKLELTNNRIIRSVRQTNLSLEPAGAHLLLHVSQAVLRNSEVGIDRIQTLDHQQGVAVTRRSIGRTATTRARAAGIYYIADINEALAGAAGDRRANVAVAELHLGVLNRRRINLDALFGTVNRGPVGIDGRIE